MKAPTGPVLVFDEVVGSAGVYSHTSMDAFLGRFDKYSFQMICSPASGTLGTVSARLKVSSDLTNWVDKNAAAEVTSATCSATAQVVAAGNDPGTGTNAGHKFGRLLVTAATAMQVSVKIWATARDI